MKIHMRFRHVLAGITLAGLAVLLPLENGVAEEIRFEKVDKPRVLILTDIENEPDDAMSMVRLMTYANMMDIEGLVATTSCWQRDAIADWRIHEIVDAYGKVRDNLLKHEPGYPTQEFLKSRIKKGIPAFGMAAVGEGKDSEGSEWVISVVDRGDERPVWVPVWGGANVPCMGSRLGRRERLGAGFVESQGNTYTGRSGQVRFQTPGIHHF